MKLDIKQVVTDTHNLNALYRYTVTLSRRNLLALLTKLDDPTSLRTIFVPTANGVLYVTAEDDATHYANRPAPGSMSPRTERDIAVYSAPADLAEPSSQPAFDFGAAAAAQTHGDETV